MSQATFADWAVKAEAMLRGDTSTAWLAKGERIKTGSQLTEAERWAKTITGDMKWSAYQTNLFWSTVGDPGFWCQLATFLVLGVLFRAVGFGDGPHNGVLLDASTFTIGWILETTLATSMPTYKMREESAGPLQYAHNNFVPRLAIVPFTSTFVPLLYGWSTGSLENIAACWVQHFIVLAISWWSLAVPVAAGIRDFTGRPYAQCAFKVDELRGRMSALGPFVLCSDMTVGLYEGIREGEHGHPATI